MTTRSSAWTYRALLVAGLFGVLVGTIDPLEGSIAMVGGFAFITLAAYRRQSRHRVGLAWSVLLVAVGVVVMFLVSSNGGFGGTSGRSAWWGLTILPYTVGWTIGVVESFLLIREQRSAGLVREAS